MKSDPQPSANPGNDSPESPTTTSPSALQTATAWLALILASMATWLYYQPNDHRELYLWTIFSNLFNTPIFWGGESGDLALLLFRVIAAWGLTIAIGFPVVRLIQRFGLPPLAIYEQIALSYILGMGLLGLLGEFLALAGILQPVALWITLVLALVAIIIATRRLQPTEVRASDMLNQELTTDLFPADSTLNIFGGLFLAVTALIFFFITWHALFYPVTYWDAMILYVGYARMIYLEGAIPEYIVGQVGIGLGANYPHLFAFYHVSLTNMLAGEWTSIFAQSVSPACGMAISALIFGVARRLGATFWAASATCLLGVSFHYIIAYYQYASNYPTAMAFTVAYLWGGLVYMRDKRAWGGLVLAILMAALAVHVNYLMWLLWAAGLILMALVPWRAKLATSRRYWLLVAVGLALASPWYIRNVIVTGNPVYAFYSNIFPSKNVNPEVMESAGHEWVRNGDGIGNHARQLAGTDDYTLWDKIRATPSFLATGPQAYKLGPVFLGWMVPGAVGVGALLLLSFIRRNEQQKETAETDTEQTKPVYFYLWCLLLALLFWSYHYFIAGFYLYQILPFLIAGYVLIAGFLIVVQSVHIPAYIMSVLILATGIVPGLAFSMMGLKVFVGGTELVALHKPLMDPETFYQLRYGDDVKMWRYVNENLPGEMVLTHENRHLAFDPSIKIIQLDDWEMQAAYDLPTAEEKFQHVLDFGIRYYLYVPNEDKHPVNRRLGIQEFIGTERLKVLYRADGTAGPNVLFELIPPDA
jgi:4-amino-4-deoxy-L-arabinose transferase-like glycosyltransferase